MGPKLWLAFQRHWWIQVIWKFIRSSTFVVFHQHHQLSQMILSILSWFDFVACFNANTLLYSLLQPAIKVTRQRVLGLGCICSEITDTPIPLVIVCNLLIVYVANCLEKMMPLLSCSYDCIGTGTNETFCKIWKFLFTEACVLTAC